MGTLTIRNLDDEVHRLLRHDAADRGKSVEATVREILDETMARRQSHPGMIAKRLHARFAGVGGADDLDLPQRDALPEPPTLRE